MKVVFLDRDGTVIQDFPDFEWSEINEPKFLEDAIEGLIEFKELGYKFIVITNQYLINEGFISIDDYANLADKFLVSLSKKGIYLLDMFYCPHSRDENCDCMKPKPGMILKALEMYKDIDLNESIYIGDSLCDRELAIDCGIRFFGIKSDGKDERFKYTTILEVSKSIRASK